MTAQEQNTDLVKLLSVYFVENDNPAYAWGQACAGILALPALRAFWPMSSVDYAAASRARDVAGGGYHLSDNNTPLFGGDQLAPYAEFNGTTQYLSRADGGAGNWADIIGTEAYVVAAQRGQTLGGWFRWNALPAATTMLIGKLQGGQLAYRLRKDAAHTITFSVRSGGVWVDVVSTATVAVNTWYYIVGRFVPGSSVDVFIDGTGWSTATAAAVGTDSPAIFTIGARGNPDQYFGGRASLCFMCAAALSDSQIGVIYQQTRRLFQRT